jgi:hypothetical protein
MCKHHGVCHAGVPARRNCRTCVAVTKGNATWSCERHDKTLMYDDQQKGCDDHRYDPSFINGDQIDFDDQGAIVYKMPDGEIFKDEGK